MRRVTASTNAISKVSDAPCEVPGQQLCDLNFDNHVHGNAQFLGQSDIKHI